MFLFFLHGKVLILFGRGRRGEAPERRSHGSPAVVVAAVFVRQLRGPHLSTWP